MKIEVILPKYCLKLGSQGNLQILSQIFREVDIIETHFDQAPKFSKEPIDLVYVGSYDDHHQEIIFSYFKKYRKQWAQAIENGQNILMTGNSWDIFGESFQKENGEIVSGLELFPFKVFEDYHIRHNFFSIGETASGHVIGGLVAEFTSKQITGELPYSMKMIRGEGFAPDAKHNGLHKNHLIALNYYGPLLAYNIDLIKWIADMTGYPIHPSPLTQLITENTEFIHGRFQDPDITYISAI